MANSLVMSLTTDTVESRVTGRFAVRLANRVQSTDDPSVAQVISWLDLVDLCREMDDALIEVHNPSPEMLRLHDAVLSLAIGCGAWLLNQIDLNEIDLSKSGHTRETLAATLELVRIFHRSRHTEFPASEVEAVRQRIFNAAA